MTQRFLKAMPHVFIHEGGYNDIKEDKGGATNYGISLMFLKSIGGDLNEDGQIDWLDIKSLTKEEAQELYWDNFWKPLYDRIPEKLGIKVFDTAINTGHLRAHMILQQALKTLGSDLVIDGVIGSQTISELAKYSELEVLESYCNSQLKFYQGIVEKNPSQSKFIKGWTNRAKWKP